MPNRRKRNRVRARRNWISLGQLVLRLIGQLCHVDAASRVLFLIKRASFSSIIGMPAPKSGMCRSLDMEVSCVASRPSGDYCRAKGRPVTNLDCA